MIVTLTSILLIVFRDSLVQNAASRGLQLFLKVLKSPNRDRDSRLKIVMENMGHFVDNDLKSSASQGAIRRDLHTSEKDVWEQAWEPMDFEGDSPDIIDAPPFAWWLMWRGTYSNRYGDEIPDKLREWGYVFWDRERIIGARARELLVDTWRRTWRIDPRTLF